MKIEPDAGVAVSVSCVPSGNASVQSVPQSMPVGLDVIVPMPLPVTAIVTVRFSVGGAASGELGAT